MRTLRLKTIWTLPLALLFLVAVPGDARAMSGEHTLAEAEEASREDALAGLRRGDTQVPETLLRGTFFTNREACVENPDVVGVLVVYGRGYRLKAGNQRLQAELLKRNGQEVALEGEVRNQGKYFIARRFAAALPPAVTLRDRKGL